MATMSPDDIAALASTLRSAQDKAQPIEALTDDHPGMSVEDAYAVQRQLITGYLHDGAALVGHKIGITSREMQRFAGIDQPDFGHLLDWMVQDPDRPVDRGRLIAPKAEGELAFVLGEDLEGPGVTVTRVLQAVEFLIPAIEIVDSRIRDWRIKLADTIADNASSGRVVLGGCGRPIAGVDLPLIGMVLRKNGEIVQTAAGAAVMGHPAAAAAWLANKLSEFGTGLRRGQLVLAGAFGGPVDLDAGDVVHVEFTGCGSVMTAVA
jgi:2-keto-4-pentenoate hydratase